MAGTHFLVVIADMGKPFLDMMVNVRQLRALTWCHFISQTNKGFSVELNIRDGKYKLRMDYKVNAKPNIYVLSPEIDMSNSIEIHTFGMHYHPYYKKPLPELCLTYQKTDHWKSSTPLLQSFIPWAIEWTEFYEIWCLTGKWFGKGIHAGEKKNG